MKGDFLLMRIKVFASDASQSLQVLLFPLSDLHGLYAHLVTAPTSGPQGVEIVGKVILKVSRLCGVRIVNWSESWSVEKKEENDNR